MSFEYPKGIRFKCNRCTLCCGDTEKRARMILLLEMEAGSISQLTGETVEDFAERVEDHEPYVYVMRKSGDGKCGFLRDGTCSIYRMRPLICRFYPFELKGKRNRFVFAHTDECPCIGEGSELKKEYFEELLARFKESMRKTREKG